jgi:hypothetical protein
MRQEAARKTVRAVAERIACGEGRDHSTAPCFVPATPGVERVAGSPSRELLPAFGALPHEPARGATPSQAASGGSVDLPQGMATLRSVEVGRDHEPPGGRLSSVPGCFPEVARRTIPRVWQERASVGPRAPRVGGGPRAGDKSGKRGPSSARDRPPRPCAWPGHLHTGGCAHAGGMLYLPAFATRTGRRPRPH